MNTCPINPTYLPAAIETLGIATSLSTGRYDAYAREALEEAILLLCESAGLSERQRGLIGAMLNEKWSGGRSEYEMAKARGDVREVRTGT